MSAAEHMARLKAEGEAQNSSRMLAVAQEQLAEYAAQKEADAAQLLEEAQELEALINRTMQGEAAESSGVGADEVVAQLQKLQSRLLEADREAKAFSAMQRADIERFKRNSEQVGRCIWQVQVPYEDFRSTQALFGTFSHRLIYLALRCCTGRASNCKPHGYKEASREGRVG